MALSKKSKTTLIVIVALCVVVCVAFATISMRGCAVADPVDIHDVSGYETVESWDFDAEDVKSLDVGWGSGALVIRSARAGDAVLEGDPNAIKVVERVRGNVMGEHARCELDGSTLRASVEHDPISFLSMLGSLFGMRSHRLEVIVPEGYSEKLESLSVFLSSGSGVMDGIGGSSASVTVRSGSFSCANLASEKLDVELSSGSLHMSDSSTRSLDARVASGSADIAVSAKEAGIRLSSGSMHLRMLSADIDAMRADVTSGSLDVLLPEDTGFDAAATKSSGSFDCAFDAEKRGDTYQHGDGSAKLDFFISSGRASIAPA